MYKVIKVKNKDLFLHISDEVGDNVSDIPSLFNRNNWEIIEMFSDLQLTNIPIDGHLPSDMEIRDIHLSYMLID